jgi:hypothetical protein
VTLFTKQWVERPSDLFVEKEYKQLLLELERASALDVIERNGQPAPREKRRKSLELPTLADRYWVRLA